MCLTESDKGSKWNRPSADVPIHSVLLLWRYIVCMLTFETGVPLVFPVIGSRRNSPALSVPTQITPEMSGAMAVMNREGMLLSPKCLITFIPESRQYMP